MSGHSTYAFLIDEDLMHLVHWFPKGRAKTVVTHARQRGTPDPEVVAIAFDTKRTIVTNNSKDYRREVLAFSRQSGRARCSDLFGLVLMPDDEADQRQFFPLQRRLTAKLRYRGRKIDWLDVHTYNLLVQADRDGRVFVSQLPRCAFCERDLPFR